MVVFEDEAHVSTWLIQLSSVTALNGRTAFDNNKPIYFAIAIKVCAPLLI